MRLLRGIFLGLAAVTAISLIPGCDDGSASTEVHRTPEFQKAAQNSKYAMMDYMKSQKVQKKSSTKQKSK